MRRLNARLDEEFTKKFELIKKRNAMNDSTAIKAAIDYYYQHVCKKGATPIKELLADFIGCAEGSTELSKNYKKLLNSTLKHKL